jgi:hypothetical protein
LPEAKKEDEPKIIKRRVHIHGLKCPWNLFQILSYLVILLDSYAFYFITIVAYSYSAGISVTIGIIYSLILMVVLYYGYIATKIDPTDPTIHAYRERITQGKEFDCSGL